MDERGAPFPTLFVCLFVSLFLFDSCLAIHKDRDTGGPGGPWPPQNFH